MRKIILLLSLLISVLSYAGDKFAIKPSSSLKKQPFENQLKEVRKPGAFSLVERISSLQRQEVKTTSLEEASLKSAKLKQSLPTASLLQKATGTTAIATLDSLIVYNVFEEKESKQEFTYDDKENLLSIKNYYWNYYTSIWDLAQTIICEYDENGNLTLEESIYSYDGYTEGSRYEFTYENDLVVIEIISHNFGNGWSYSEKNEFSYDEQGNAIGWVMFNYSNGEWTNNSKLIGGYDNANRLILQESYYWNLDWVGSEKAIYKFDENGNQLLWGYSEWQHDTKEWLYNHKYEQVFENNNLVLQQESFWNPDNQDWNGGNLLWGEPLRNNKTEFTYDEQGRCTLEVAYHYLSNEWVKQVSMEYEYTSLDNGETQMVRETYFHTNGKVNTGTLTERYGPDGQLTYRLEILESVKQYEEFYVYDDAGNLLEKIWYYFEGDVRYADAKWLYEYNKDGKVIIFDTYLGLAGNDPEAWGPYTRWTYKYENNIEIERMGHYPDKVTEGFQWHTINGEGYEYDFSVPYTDLIVPGGYEYPYKLDRQLIYVTLVEDPDAPLNFDEIELSVEVGEYYYTLKEIESSANIEENLINSFNIYPNPTTDVLYINSSEEVEVNLYNLQGTKLLQVVDKQIDLSNLASGIYIIELNGVKTKVIKK